MCPEGELPTWDTPVRHLAPPMADSTHTACRREQLNRSNSAKSEALDGHGDTRDDGQSKDDVAHQLAVEPMVHHAAQEATDHDRGQQRQCGENLLLRDRS